VAWCGVRRTCRAAPAYVLCTMRPRSSVAVAVVCCCVVQLATNEKVVFILGQHLNRLSKFKFSKYERAMYRQRAITKWAPFVSYSCMWPELSVWHMHRTRK
jgi:hypothetical protein